MMLDNDDLTRISGAVRAAELNTSGEIVVVIDRVAGRFRSVSISMALVLGLLVPWPLIALTSISAQRIFLFQLVATCIALGFFLWSGRNGGLVPQFIRRRHAHEVAMREFMVRGLSRTRDRTGILIYVALAERYAEVVADTGIADKVDADAWRGIIEEITTATKEGRLADGLVGAVEQAGRLLAKDFPPRENDTDELSDKVIVI
jgi:putative membrane protein